jgi:hypothetical protein
MSGVPPGPDYSNLLGNIGLATYELGDKVQTLNTALDGIAAQYGTMWQGVATGLGDVVSGTGGFLTGLLGDKPANAPDDWSWLWSGMAGPLLKTAIKALTGDTGNNPTFSIDPADRLKGLDANANPIAAWFQSQVQEGLLAKLPWNEPDPSGGDGQVWGRFAKCLGIASAMGLGAHGVSVLLSSQVLGSSLGSSTGIAAMVGQFAGFGPICNSINETVYEAYLRKPWEREINARLRPNRPSVGEYVRWYAHNRLTGQTQLQDELKAAGYKDADITLFLTDCYRLPQLRNLTDLADDLNLPDDDLEKVLQYQGFHPDYVKPLTKVLQYKRVKALCQRTIGVQLDAYAEGRMEKKVWESDLAVLEPDLRRQAAWHDLADRMRLDFRRKAVAKYATDRYDRGQLTEVDFLGELVVIGFDPDAAGAIVNEALAKRFHAVPLYTDRDAAMQAEGAGKALYKQGRLTGGQLRSLLMTASIQPAAADLIIAALASHKNGQLSAPAKLTNLTTLRDLVLEGRITRDAFKAELAGRGWGDPQLGYELAFLDAKVLVQKEGQVAKYQIPVFEQEYSHGGIPAAELDAAYHDAGYSAAQIASRHAALDPARAANLAAV